MANPSGTYREAGARERVEFGMLLVLWMGVIIAALVLLPDDIHGGLAFGLMVLVASLLWLPLRALAHRQRRRRTAGMQAALSSEGYSFRPAPGESERRAVLDQIGAHALLRADPACVDWIARRHDRGRDVIVLRHSHVDGSGRTMYDRTSTVVAIPTGDPRPGVWLTRTNVITARRDADSGHRQDLQLGDPWLDANFRIQSVHPSAPARILTAPVRGLIASGPSKESWTLGWGYVVCVFGADTTPDGVLAMIRRSWELLALLESDQG